MNRKILSIFLIMFTMVTILFKADYATAASTWTTEPNMPYDSNVVTPSTPLVKNDKIYVLQSDKIGIFDLNTKTWSVGSDPISSGVTRRACANLNDNMYFFGGHPEANTHKVDVYNISSNTWSRAQDMPYEALASTAITYNGKIYVFSSNLHDGNSYIQIYNPQTNSWTSLTMPYGIYHATSQVYNGKVYIFGGLDSTLQNSSYVYIYDISTNTWNLENSMPISKHNISSVLIGNEIYILGGAASNIYDTIDIYNILTNSWSKGINLSSQRYGLSSAVANNTLYVFGATEGNSKIVESIETKSLKLKHLKLVLEVGEEIQLSIANNLSENVNGKWTNSNTSVASMTNGYVKARSVGNTTISVTYPNGKTEYIDILVVDDADDYRLAVDLKMGEKCRLTIDDYTNTIPVTWIVLNNNVATISTTGKVTAVGAGLTLVTATDQLGNIVGEIYIRVR